MLEHQPQPKGKKTTATGPAKTKPPAPKTAPPASRPGRKTTPKISAPQPVRPKATPTGTGTHKLNPPVRPQPAPTNAPKATGGITNFFRKQLTTLHKSGLGKSLTGLADGARKIVQGAASFARNPVKSTLNGAVALGKYGGQKLDQFKKWYATPEGKAKFWKGVALTAVGIATVASGGALTAPALALAAGISAGGGIAAQVVENKVFNAAAKTKAQKDKTYKFKQRSTFEGVTARSIAVDAVVGSIGGPVFKFAGKVVAGSVRALGKGALPAARGLGHLAQATLNGSGKAAANLARKVLPQGARTLLKNAGTLAKKYLVAPLRTAATATRTALRTAATATGNTMKRGARRVQVSVSRRARQAHAFLKKHTPTLRKLARKGADAVTSTVRKAARTFRQFDGTLLTRLRNHVEKSPALKLARKLRDTVDRLGNRASRNLVNAKVKTADAFDSLKARAGKKLSQTQIVKALRQANEKTAQYLTGIVERNPGGHLAKAITEFRASGAAIRTHLNKVWSEAGHEMNKDLSALLGRHGSVQADLKALAEKGGKALYDTEIAAAKEATEKRLRDKIATDLEAVYVARQGEPLTAEIRAHIQARAQADAHDAVSKMQNRIMREAENHVSRHPSVQLHEVAMNTATLEARAKAIERYFGKNAEQRGLIERMGLGLTTPARVPINERVEKYTKVVQALRSTTPLGSTVALGIDAVEETFAKAVEKTVSEPVKAKVKVIKGEKTEPKKATEEDTHVLLKLTEEMFKEVLPPLDPDSYLEDVSKKLNMKDGD
ncbi:hypothetical protein LAJ19_10645 [Deinococcus taeanensis]|uniref:hypothetical protein n=1 Tax=Deinococcus taeanensis TaxID=2737050 RepID=UPI001CDC2EFA|nr:hypothetical protein [Deinococcus taeanensis]UBV42090.1 hypothetical protein LAJ19_10645 [Deinococcus taeanensis]